MKPAITIVFCLAIFAGCDDDQPNIVPPGCGNGVIDEGENYDVNPEGQFIDSGGVIIDSTGAPLSCTSAPFGFLDGVLQLDSECTYIDSLGCTGCPEDMFACAGQCHDILIVTEEGEREIRGCYRNQLVVIASTTGTADRNHCGEVGHICGIWEQCVCEDLNCSCE